MVKYLLMSLLNRINLFTINTRPLILFSPFFLASTHSSPCREVLLCRLWANGDRQASIWQVWAWAFTLNTVHLGTKVSPYLLAGICPLFDSRNLMAILRYFSLGKPGELGCDCRLCIRREETYQGFSYLLSNRIIRSQWVIPLQAHLILFLGPSRFAKKCVLQI